MRAFMRSEDEYIQRLAYVAHAGCMDVLLDGFRRHLGQLTFADVKILRVMRAAGDYADLELIVSAVVATAMHELNTSEKSARERIKNLQLDGMIEAEPGKKRNQTVLRMSDKCKSIWTKIERDFLEILPQILSVIEHYRDGAAETPADCDNSWKLCDPLHPDHAHMIKPRSFTQRGQ